MVGVKVMLRGSGVYRICSDRDELVDCICAVTGDNMDVVQDVDGWSDLASVGEIYEHRDFIAEILEV